MPKVDTELVKLVLQRNGMELRQVANIMEDIEAEMQQMKEEEEKPPPVKKQFVMLLSDPQGELEGKDIVGWVLQVPEDDDPRVATERLMRGAYDFNVTPKGRRIPVKSIGEACEVVTARILKEHNVWVKTKEPVTAITTDNKLPTPADTGAL